MMLLKWDLKYDTGELMKKKQTHKTWRTDRDCQGGGGRGGKDWEAGVSGCKLVCTERINNMVLLYSVGNYI